MKDRASEPESTARRRRRLPRAIAVAFGGAAALFGLLAVPLWAEWTLALAPLDPTDWLPLGLITAVFVGLGLTLWRSRSPRLAALMLPLLMFAGLETAARLWLRFAGSNEARAESVALADRTYPGRAAFVGHPFLQFTGRPDRRLAGADVLGKSRFNNLGFISPDAGPIKPADVVRIAFIGGSTTATGYYWQCQRRLAELGKEAKSGRRFECLSFALGFYTSTHSTVNFVLNVRDYAPDYVVFLHGWNDLRALGRADDFRGDYAHAYRPFELPPIRDALLIRGSVIYRYLAARIAPTPRWADLGAATLRPHPAGGAWDRLEATYLRNVDTIVTLAHAAGIVPVLVTQAHSTDPAIGLAADAEGIGRMAARLREAARGYGDGVVFVDLDAETTGIHDEFFKDVGHHNAAGIEFKGQRVAEAIWAHWSGH
ncbi:MAG: hypothetical protein KDE27_17980 [Planctomycetes bacterium]|nr:hypothetical protein [Planctomycetota bacterium]